MQQHIDYDHQILHSLLERNVFQSLFPCIGAQKIVRDKNYSFCVIHQSLESKDAAYESHELLTRWFKSALYETVAMNADWTKFVTAIHVFEGPCQIYEDDMEKVLWNFLSNLHEIDKKKCMWDKQFSSNIYSSHFGMSVGGYGHFIPLLSPAATSIGRYFPYPALVFNPHFIFGKMRKVNMFDKWKEVIVRRNREVQFGWINPKLTDHGTNTEAAQYALTSNPVFNIGLCPFSNNEATDIHFGKSIAPPYPAGYPKIKFEEQIYAGCPFHK